MDSFLKNFFNLDFFFFSGSDEVESVRCFSSAVQWLPGPDGGVPNEVVEERVDIRVDIFDGNSGRRG